MDGSFSLQPIPHSNQSTLDIQSKNTKKDTIFRHLYSYPIPFGGANGTRSETEQITEAQDDSETATKRLYIFFRDCLPFRAVSCVE